MIQKEVKLTFISGVEGVDSSKVKKTLTFGYIKEDVTEEEVKTLGNTILNSDCYPFLEFVSAAIVDTETTEIEVA